jgi:hypothetical protein
MSGLSVVACGRKITDYTESRVGRLWVIGVASEFGSRRSLWKCVCDCRSMCVVRGDHLKQGVKSCGCMRRRRKESPPQLSLQEALEIAATSNVLVLPKREYDDSVALWNNAVDAYERGASSRSYEWLLTKEQAIKMMKSPCHYCGDRPSLEISSRPYGKRMARNGIDRIDNTLGYSLANCVPCCATCNRCKGTLHRDEFIGLARKIVAIDEQRTSSANYLDSDGEASLCA